MSGFPPRQLGETGLGATESADEEPMSFGMSLFEVGSNGALLHASTCANCGAVYFPPQPFGCERCGAEPTALAPIDLVPEGVLETFAIVHSLDPAGEVIIGEVRLDSGPLVRVRLAALADVGCRMIGVATPETDASNLCFVIKER